MNKEQQPTHIFIKDYISPHFENAPTIVKGSKLYKSQRNGRDEWKAVSPDGREYEAIFTSLQDFISRGQIEEYCEAEQPTQLSAENENEFENIPPFDLTNTQKMAEDVWLFLTNDSMPEKATIKKDAFLHEVRAMLTSAIANATLTQPAPQPSQGVEEAIKERIKQLNEADAAFCKDRWNPESDSHIRMLAREESNKVTFARQELESIFKLMQASQQPQSIQEGEQIVYVPTPVSEKPKEQWYGILNKFGTVRQAYFNGKVWREFDNQDPQATHWLKPVPLSSLLNRPQSVQGSVATEGDSSNAVG